MWQSFFVCETVAHNQCCNYCSDKNRTGKDDYYGKAKTTVPELLNAEGSLHTLVVEKVLCEPEFHQRWNPGVFVEVKCRKLAVSANCDSMSFFVKLLLTTSMLQLFGKHDYYGKAKTTVPELLNAEGSLHTLVVEKVL